MLISPITYYRYILFWGALTRSPRLMPYISRFGYERNDYLLEGVRHPRAQRARNFRQLSLEQAGPRRLAAAHFQRYQAGTLQRLR